MIVSSSLISQVGLVGAALLTVLGVVYTARATKASNARSAALNEIQSSRTTWKEDAVDLRRQLKEDEEKHDKEMAEIKKLLDDLTKEYRDHRVTCSEEQMNLKIRLNELILWAREVMPILRESGKRIPPVPPGVLNGSRKREH